MDFNDPSIAEAIPVIQIPNCITRVLNVRRNFYRDTPRREQIRHFINDFNGLISFIVPVVHCTGICIPVTRCKNNSVNIL